MKIKTAIHEGNAYPGLTTKLLLNSVDLCMLSSEEAVKHLGGDHNFAVTGLPVRKNISRLTRADGKKALGFDNGMCLLSFGGSLGSKRINEVILEIMPELDKMGISHIHGYGRNGAFLPSEMEKRGIDPVSKRRRVSEYINDMDICMAAADLVICRSGMSAVEELQYLGRASILIPSPNVTENHQYHNAMVLGRAGAAVVIEEKDLTSELLLDKIREFSENPEKLILLARHAAKMYVGDTPERIYSALEKLLPGR